MEASTTACTFCSPERTATVIWRHSTEHSTEHSMAQHGAQHRTHACQEGQTPKRAADGCRPGTGAAQAA